MLKDTSQDEIVVPLAYPPALAAKATGRSRSRIYRAINGGELTAKKDGKATLIERAELQRWLAALPTMPASRSATA